MSPGISSAQKRQQRQELERTEAERIAGIQDSLASQTADFSSLTRKAPLFKNGFVVK